MSVYSGEDRVVFEGYHEEEAEILGSICRIGQDGEPAPAGATMEAEKRIRRQIANSNERRRMQSINAGFQSLRTLLPHHEGEKLSKAAILQQTAEYIYSLEQEKTQLLSQNCQLKRLVNQHEGGELPPKKRKTEVLAPIKSESSDEGLGSMSPEPVNILTADQTELRRQLDRERGLRVVLEDRVCQLEAQLYQPVHYPTAEEPAEDIALQLVEADSVPPVGHTQTVVCSPAHSRTPSPEPEQRLPSALEAAIKAEPKVEVERLPSPNTPHDDRIYNTSRQNLETIVEAIRHLEGDHLFGDEPSEPKPPPPALQTQQQPQEVPLALTTTQRQVVVPPERRLQAEMTSFLQFRSPLQQQQQSRPGVIVVKQQS